MARLELAARKHFLHEICRRFTVFAILNSMRHRPFHGLALVGVLALGVAARADEFRLKDGTKISGTIVGFENDSFKVETAYGFALVRKDKIAEIIPSAPKKEPEPKSKSESDPKPKPDLDPKPKISSASKPSPELFPTAVPAPAPASSTATEAPAPVNAAASGRTAGAENPPAPPAKKETPAAKEKAVAAAPSPPPPPPGPPPIRDETRGNIYVNYTFGFQMFKPPSWELIPEARKALPDAVAAMGTGDQTTLLVIGRELVKNSLEAHAAKTEKTLSEIYENYRVISARSTAIAGLPGIERRVRGTVDGHDWSVILVEFQRGTDVFTLLGMTWANSDLIQMQENVLSRAINSLAFTPATP